MQKLFLVLIFVALSTFSMNGIASAACGQDKKFFGLPTWYKHLEFEGQNCEIKIKERIVTYDSKGKVKKVNDQINFKTIWLILFAVVEIILRLAGFLAFVFVLVGGFKYVLSQGNPEKTANALQTIKNALIGVIIAIVASQLVSFLVGRLKS